MELNLPVLRDLVPQDIGISGELVNAVDILGYNGNIIMVSLKI